MKIGCVCPTYKRPLLLGRALHCFFQQTYRDSYLVVLDDAGQYEPQQYRRWKLVVTSRYPSLGAKRQAGIEMLPPDCEGYMCWDDDDVYFPGAVEAVANALRLRPWAQCRLVYETAGPGELAVTRAFGISKNTSQEKWGYGGCWAYRIAEHQRVGGYDGDPARSSNDDLDLARKFHGHYGASANSTLCIPWYWYNRDPGVNKVCQEGVDFWQKREVLPFEQMSLPPIGWNGDNIYKYPVLNEPPRPLGWMER